jgi:hypothetical protein
LNSLCGGNSGQLHLRSDWVYRPGRLVPWRAQGPAGHRDTGGDPNVIVGTDACGPSDYLPRLANSAKVDIDTIGKHVATHLADADLMARDDFEAFFATRARALLDKISSAMGKPIEDLDLIWETDGSYATEDAADTDDM